MSRRREYPARAWLAAAALIAAVSTGAYDAAAQQSGLIGLWECTGQANGLTYVSWFDYQPDGSYRSTQRISANADFIEGGGGGAWRLEGDILHDTKERATLDRFVRNGVEVPPSDPEWQALAAQAQASVGTTLSGQIRIVGDVAFSGMYTCHRQR